MGRIGHLLLSLIVGGVISMPGCWSADDTTSYLHILESAQVLDTGVLGERADHGKEFDAYSRLRLMNQKVNKDNLLSSYGRATAVGKVYLAILIANLDAQEGQRLISGLRKDPSIVDENAGCMKIKTSIAEVARKLIEERTYGDLLMPEMQKEASHEISRGEAVQLACSFLREQGYLEFPATAKQLKRELLDKGTDSEIGKMRQGKLRAEPYGIMQGQGTWTVVFRYAGQDNKGIGRVVMIKAPGGKIWLEHQDFKLSAVPDSAKLNR